LPFLPATADQSRRENIAAKRYRGQAIKRFASSEPAQPGSKPYRKRPHDELRLQALSARISTEKFARL
jgi:hypothetical protein